MRLITILLTFRKPFYKNTSPGGINYHSFLRKTIVKLYMVINMNCSPVISDFNYILLQIRQLCQVFKPKDNPELRGMDWTSLSEHYILPKALLKYFQSSFLEAL